jgi:hypothetical protein
MKPCWSLALTSTGIQSYCSLRQHSDEIHYDFDYVLLTCNVLLGRCLRYSDGPAKTLTKARKALFSTTFFRFSDQGWETSDMVWLYWAVAAPATILVLILYGSFMNARVQDFTAQLHGSN